MGYASFDFSSLAALGDLNIATTSYSGPGYSPDGPIPLPPINFPVLTSLGGMALLCPLADISAPNLYTVSGYVDLFDYHSLNAPITKIDGSLQVLESTTMQVLNLPSLTSIGGELDVGIEPLCSSPPYATAKLIALNLPLLSNVGVGNAGAVTFGSNALLPKCRAQALVSQLTQAGWTGTATYACAMPAGPCP